MISIPLHLSLYYKNPNNELLKQANIFWKYLNPRTRGKPHVGSLISEMKIYRQLAITGDLKYLSDYANNSLAVAADQARLFSYFLKNNAKILKQVIVSSPNQLHCIKNNIKASFPDALFTRSVRGRISQTPFGKLLSEEIFDYKKFRGSQHCVDFLKFVHFKSIFCPYCGEMPVKLAPVIPGTAKLSDKVLADLDHFFSKAEHPYLAISIFNLIPSCHSCNSSYKGTKAFQLVSHIHPYLESFDDQFSFDIEDVIAGKCVVIKEKTALAKKLSADEFGIAMRYFNENVLLEIEADYKSHVRYNLTNTMDQFIDYMLKGVPRKRSTILTKQYGKAKRDIIFSIDFLNILKPKLND